MRFTSSILGKLVEPINRRQFQAIVARHEGDAYDKSFRSWDHLMVLLYGQLSGTTSLRSLEAGWNANSQHHYHLGSGPLRRSTLSDAGRRRPEAIFAEVFGLVACQLDRQMRREGADLLRLMDSTPIPLGKLCGWAKSNGRICGMKVHMVYDPHSDCARVLEITDANVNDAQIGRSVQIEKGATYIFDKGYCHYAWWTAIADKDAFFVTRPKSNMQLDVLVERPLQTGEGDGFTVLDDAEVRLASKGDSKLPIVLRRLRLQRQNGDILTLLTNDLARSAIDVAKLYKTRWQIELLFRWIKQHLKVRKFLAVNDNAIRLQLFAAMIAFALLRIAASANRVALPILRFTNLVACCLFQRRDIAAIERPPPINPSRAKSDPNSNQLAFLYA